MLTGKTMTRKIIVLTTLLFALFTSIGYTYGQSRNTTRKGQTGKGKTLLEVASMQPQLSTFVKAIKAAELEKTLDTKGNQNFTVFAPSNAAFDSLPSGAKEDLLKPENKEQLRNILLNHMVSGKFTSAALTNEKNLQSIGGKEIGISNLGGKIMAGGKDVNKADIEATNGVIHIINVVIVPPVEEADADKE
jgi:uncharacterized surface protein with fasciclin (FAS1) repeats